MVAREGPRSGVLPVLDVCIHALLHLAVRLSWYSVVLSLRSQSALSFRGAGNLTEFVVSATERDVVWLWRTIGQNNSTSCGNPIASLKTVLQFCSQLKSIPIDRSTKISNIGVDVVP